MKCTQLAPNGAESRLYNTLLELADNNMSKATALYSYFSRPTFVDSFGTPESILRKDGPESNRVDHNGEPILHKDTTTNKYYYIDKNNQNVFFPVDRHSLKANMSVADIKSVAQYLGMDYLKTIRNISLENFDLDTVINDISLEQFIREKYESKLQELEDVDTPEADLAVVLLEDTLPNIKEWIPHITNFYKKMNITYEDGMDSLNIEEDTKDPSYTNASFHQDSKRNVRTVTKLKLATLPNPTGFNPLFGKGANYVSFSQVYSLLENDLNNNFTYLNEDGTIVDIADRIIKKLTDLSSKRPELYPIVEAMKKDSDFRTSMVVSFKNQRNNVIVNTLQNKGYNAETAKANYNYTQKNISASTSYAKGVVENWANSFYYAMFGSEHHLKDKTVAKALIENIENSIQEITSSVNKHTDETFVTDYNKYITQLQEVIENKLGLNIDTRALFDMFNSNDQGLSDRQWLVNHLNSFKKDMSDIRNSGEVDKAADIRVTNHNLLANSSFIRALAKNQAIYDNAQSASTVHAGGKSLYIMSNINYLMNRVEVWKLNPAALIKFYNNSNDYVKSSLFLKFLTASDERDNLADTGIGSKAIEEAVLNKMSERLSKVSIGILTDLFITDSSNSMKGNTSSIQEMSMSDYITSEFNAVIANKYFRTTTPADKSNNFVIDMGSVIINAFGGINVNGNPIEINAATRKIFANYFASEITRMKTEDALIRNMEDAVARGEDVDITKLITHYHFKEGEIDYTVDENGKVTKLKILERGNAFKSQILEELSFGAKSSSFQNNDERDSLRVQAAARIRELLYLPDGTINEDVDTNTIINERSGKLLVDSKAIVSADLGSLISHYLGIVLSDGSIKAMTKLTKSQVFEKDVNGNISNIKLDSKVLDGYTRKYERLLKLQPGELDTNTLAVALSSDFYVRSLINNIEYSKLFTGDMAYYKNMVDYKKRVPATYTDGNTLYMRKDDKVNFNIAVIDGVEITTPMYEQLVKTVGRDVADKYKKINSTDAQAWITPERWKFLQERLGKWTPAHDSLYDKMTGKSTEAYTNDELKIAASPLKGVYFGINDKGRPTFLKYSQAVLTKDLIKGSPLQRVYDQMIKQDVQELITIDGVKVGAPTTSRIHNDDGSLADNIHFNVSSLSNLDWKLQQDLPTKTYKDTEVGSQIQKNIFSALVNNPTMIFNVDDVEKTGEQIMNEITNEIKALSDKGFNKLIKTFGIDEATGRITNVDRYYESLIDELRKRDGADNVIDALEKRMSIAGIPQARLRLNNVFASIINKRIVKIKTNGGSFIQMSNFGLNYKEATDAKSGIILHPDFENLSAGTMGTFEAMSYIDELGRTRVRPSGIFISGSFIAKYIPNYKDYTSEELFGTYENGKLIKKGIIDSRILENLVGYRIPNQGLASNDALQIVGILPEGNGDTVVAYTGITTKTGSDFDIDKMYLMMPSYYKEFDKRATYAVSNALFKRLRDSSIRESIENFHSFYNQISTEDVQIDDSVLEDLFNNKEVTVADKLSTMNEIRSAITSALFNPQNIDSETTKNIEEQLGMEIDRNRFVLRYADKKNQPGYHENKLIALYKAVLTQPEIIKDVMLPIDFDYMKTDVIDLTKDHAGSSNEPFFHMDPFNDIQLMYDFRNGKAGVGQEANWMVDISRRGKLELTGFNTDWFNRYKNVDHYNADKSTIKLDRATAINLSDKDMSEYMEDMSNYLASTGLKGDKLANKLAALKLEISDIKIGSAMTAILNGFVDIAKDPFITRGNWVTTTTNVGNFLLRTGLHPLYVHAFMAQPILRKYADVAKTMFPREGFGKIDQFIVEERAASLENLAETEGYTEFTNFNISEFYRLRALPKAKSEKAARNMYDLAIKTFSADVILDYAKIKESSPNYDMALAQATVLARQLADFNYTDYQVVANVENMSLRELRNSAKQVTASNLEVQFAVLDAFERYQEGTRILTDVMKIGKIDTDGIGDNISNILYLDNLVDKYTKTDTNSTSLQIKGLDSRLINSPLGVYRDNLKKFANIVKMNGDLFFNMKVDSINTINAVGLNLNNELVTNPDLVKLIESGIYQQMMDSFFNMSRTDKLELITELPARIMALKNNDEANTFITNLVVKPVENEHGTLNTIVLPNTKRDSSQQDQLTEGWSKLFKTNPSLAEDLVKYSFITTGFNMTNGQFFTLIPHDYFIDRDINKFVQTYETPSTFIHQFISNNINESLIRRNMSRFINKPINMKGGIKGYKPESFENIGTYVFFDGQVYKATSVDKSGYIIYEPFIPINNSFGNTSVSDYGDTIISQENYENTTTSGVMLNNARTEMLGITRPIDLVVKQEYNDPFGLGDTFQARTLSRDVKYFTRDYLKNVDLYDVQRKLVNMSEFVSSGKPIFQNIFTGSFDKGRININRNNLTPADVSRMQKGLTDPLPLINNLEFASMAYANWLLKNDNSFIPTDKIQQYNNLREKIKYEILNPNSTLNNALRDGYTLATVRSEIMNINYIPHTEILVNEIIHATSSIANGVNPMSLTNPYAGLPIISKDIVSPNVTITTPIDEAISKTRDASKIQQLIKYRNEVIVSQNTMFPITEADVREYINNCL